MFKTTLNIMVRKKKIKIEDHSKLDKIKKPLFYKEGSVAPLSPEEEKNYKKEIKDRFNKLIKPLSDDEFYLRVKNLLATKQMIANKDPLSTLDSYFYSEDLFFNELNRRGLKPPLSYKRKSCLCPSPWHHRSTR